MGYGSSSYYVNIANCNFISNKQTSAGSLYYGGGAIYNYFPILTIYGSSFTSNSGYYGGAIYTNSGTTTIYSPYTFTSNTASASSTYNNM